MADRPDLYSVEAGSDTCAVRCSQGWYVFDTSERPWAGSRAEADRIAAALNGRSSG